MYKIALDEAKEKEIVKFECIEDMLSVKDTLTGVIKLERDTPESELIKDKVLARFILSHVMIELIYLGYSQAESRPRLVFSVSKEIKDGEWVASEYTPLRVTTPMFQDNEYLEKLMFKYLLSFTKKHKIQYENYIE